MFSVVLREETLPNLDRNSERIWTDTGPESSSPGLPVCVLVWSALAVRPGRTEPYLRLGSSGLVETLHMASGPFYILLMYSYALIRGHERMYGLISTHLGENFSTSVATQYLARRAYSTRY